MGYSMLDFIEAMAHVDKDEDKAAITLEEFTEMMRSGDPASIEEALERMEAAGGYENLE